MNKNVIVAGLLTLVLSSCAVAPVAAQSGGPADFNNDGCIVKPEAIDFAKIQFPNVILKSETSNTLRLSESSVPTDLLLTFNESGCLIGQIEIAKTDVDGVGA